MHLTQTEMAERLGIGATRYASWESGQARPADPVGVAETLEAVTGIDRAWWLGWPVQSDDELGPKSTVTPHGAGSRSRCTPALIQPTDRRMPHAA